MFRILVVEDDFKKLKRVSSSLCEVENIDIEGIEHVVDARTAKIRLKQECFDLLILDIAIPARIDEEVRKEGGIDLFQEILDRDVYLTPSHIIGMTALDEVYNRVGAITARELLPFVYCDPTSDEWTKQLQSYVRRAVNAKVCKDAAPAHYESFLAIVCALEFPEFQAVLRNGWEWSRFSVRNDATIYYEATFRKNGTKRKCYAAFAPHKGMPAAAVLTTKMTSLFRPNYVAMSGITSGYKGKTNLGDVIVADPAWDWGSGKFVKRDGETVFEPEFYQLDLEVGIRNQLKLMAQDDTALSSIRKAWDGDIPEHELNMRLGPLASGAAVLADSETHQRILKQHRGLLGVDMEAYAVFCAAQEAPIPRPIGFVLKSVVDFADAEKSDQYQKYGAYTSAQVLKHFVEKYL